MTSSSSPQQQQEQQQPPQAPAPRGRFPIPLALRIPISAALFDHIHYISSEIFHAFKEALSCLFALFMEPILDSASLIDLSIGLLLLERVGSTLQPYDDHDAAATSSTFVSSEKGLHSSAQQLHSDMQQQEQHYYYQQQHYQNHHQHHQQHHYYYYQYYYNFFQQHSQQQSQHYSQQYYSLQDATISTDEQTLNSFAGPAFAFFGSPFCLIVSLAAMFMVVANSSSNSAIFAPLWFRILTHQSTTFIMYILVVLFCLESVLVVCILLLACHALLFPQYLEENMSILFVLSGLWTASLMASSLVRYNLYQSIGD